MGDRSTVSGTIAEDFSIQNYNLKLIYGLAAGLFTSLFHMPFLQQMDSFIVPSAWSK